MARTSIDFGNRMKERLQEKGWSYQRACVVSGIPSATIGRMALGIVPGQDHILEWAKAIHENINEWLTLAGYDPIPLELVGGKEPTKESLIALLRIAEGKLSKQDIQEIREEIDKILNRCN